MTRPATKALTRAEHLAEARVRQAGRDFASPFLTATDEQLARADADIASWKNRARKRVVAKNGWKLGPYGLEKVS